MGLAMCGDSATLHPMNEAVTKLFAEAEAKGITMGELAEAAGVDRTTAHRWKRGDSEPSVSEYEALQKKVTTDRKEKA